MVILLAVAVLLAMPNTGKAEPFGKGKFQFSAGLTQQTVYTVDTLLALFFSDFGFSESNAMGFGADFKYGMSDDWAVNWGGFFAFGSDKFSWDVVSPTPTLKVKSSAFGFHAGVDRTVNLSSMVGLYFGPGLEWMSAKSRVEDDNFFVDDDWDNPRTSAFSLHGRVGVQAMLGGHFGVNANLGQKWSKVSFSEQVGGDEMKADSWVTSMNGAAGFTIYVN
jgi:hypothetical protein